MYIVINAPGKFTFDLLLKTVDFKSEISIDNWKYLLEISENIIKISPNLKGVISAVYTKNMIVSDFSLIIKLYEITNICSNLLVRHVSMDKSLSIIKFLKSLNYSSSLLIDIFNEFLMSESKEKEIFIIQLYLCQICEQLIDKEILESLMYNFNMRTYNYCKSGNWDFLYKCLVINTLTNTLPFKIQEQFEILCQVCNLEVSQLKIIVKNSNILFLSNQHHYDLNNRTVYFKDNLLVLTLNITAFNCLTQLLKLLEPIHSNEIGYFINYIRKRKTDLYFNLLFIE